MVAQSITYPLSVVTTVTAINRSGLQAASLPLAPIYANWQDAYKYLSKTVGPSPIVLINRIALRLGSVETRLKLIQSSGPGHFWYSNSWHTDSQRLTPATLSNQSIDECLGNSGTDNSLLHPNLFFSNVASRKIKSLHTGLCIPTCLHRKRERERKYSSRSNRSIERRKERKKGTYWRR